MKLKVLRFESKRFVLFSFKILILMDFQMAQRIVESGYELFVGELEI